MLVEEARRKPYPPELCEGARGSQKERRKKNRLCPAAAPCLLAADNPGRAPPPHARGRHAHPIFRIRNIKTFCRAVHGPPKPWFVAILFRGTRWGISPTAFCRAEPSRCRRKTAVFNCKRTAVSPQHEQGFSCDFCRTGGRDRGGGGVICHIQTETKTSSGTEKPSFPWETSKPARTNLRTL